MTDDKKQPTLAETARQQVLLNRANAQAQVRDLGLFLARPQDAADHTIRTLTLARNALIKELAK
jgi:hypothetical protein